MARPKPIHSAPRTPLAWLCNLAAGRACVDALEALETAWGTNSCRAAQRLLSTTLAVEEVNAERLLAVLIQHPPWRGERGESPAAREG